MDAMSSVSRRAFLAALPAAASLSAAAAPRNPVGCRDAMLKPLGEPDCWAAAKRVKAEVLEVLVDEKLGLPLLTNAQPYSLTTPAEVARVAHDVAAAKVKISAFCVASRFDTRPDFEVEFLGKLAHIADGMGVRAMRIDVVRNRIPMEEFLASVVGPLKKLVASTSDTQVRFGMENHGNTGNDPAFLLPVLERVGSKRFGVTLDTGNFYWFGHPLSKVYELIEMVAPHVVHTHCKNITYPADKRDVQRPMGWEYAKYEAPVDKGDLDFKRVVAILKKAGYTGDLCVENETLGRMPESERAGVIASEIAYLKQVRG
jgi:sugar phosphate isomerase/epimerase